MSKKFLPLLLWPVLSFAAPQHDCTQAELPLTNEAQLLEVVYCQYPGAKVLRFERLESEAGATLYQARILYNEQIQVLVFRLADGKLLEEE